MGRNTFLLLGADPQHLTALCFFQSLGYRLNVKPLLDALNLTSRLGLGDLLLEKKPADLATCVEGVAHLLSRVFLQGKHHQQHRAPDEERKLLFTVFSTRLYGTMSVATVEYGGVLSTANATREGASSGNPLSY